MGKIIQFPTRAVRDWDTISNGINNVLSDSGASDEMRLTIIKRFNPFYDKANKEIHFNVKFELFGDIGQNNVDAIREGIQDGINLGLKQFQSIIHEMLFDHLLSEIKIYKLEQNIQ